MNNRRNGFTLIELIAAIALLTIVTLITVPAIMKIREKNLMNAFENKITLVEIAAKDYANDNLNSIPSDIHHISDLEDCKIASESGNKDFYDACIKDCFVISIRALIDYGYLAGEDKKDENGGSVGERKKYLINPITGTSMNNELVCIRYDDNDVMKRKIIAYVIGKNELIN